MLSLKKHCIINTIAMLIVLCILMVHSPGAVERQHIYAIQVATHSHLETAEKHFNVITAAADNKYLDYLRIEEVGDFYPLRIGVFKTAQEAERLLEVLKPSLPSSIVVKTYFIEKRILRVHRSQDRPTEETKKQQALPEGVTDSEPAMPGTAERTLEERLTAIAGLVHNKEYEQAEETVTQELMNHPEQPEFNGWYGTVLLLKEKPEEALKYFQQAVKRSPSTADYHNGSGYCYFYLGRYDEAIDAFDKALSLDPLHVDALAGLGIVHAKSGKREKALALHKRLKAVDRISADKLMKIIEGKPL